MNIFRQGEPKKHVKLEICVGIGRPCHVCWRRRCADVDLIVFHGGKLAKERGARYALPLCVDLNRVLTIRTLWAEYGGSYMEPPNEVYPNVHRGVWAGDRFEIMTVEKFKTADGQWPDKEEWKDVSKEVVKQMRALWIADQFQ